MGRTDFTDVQHIRERSETASRLEFLIGEHVEAFGSFSRLSDFQHVSRHQMGRGAPTAGTYFGVTGAGGKARALPTALCLVVTPTRVVATSDPGGAPDAPREEVVGAWDRATTSVEVGDRQEEEALRDTGVTVTLHLLDEDRPVQLESFDPGSDDNDEILRLLRQ